MGTEPEAPVDVIVTWLRNGSQGDWRVGPVLVRDADGVVTRHSLGTDEDTVGWGPDISRGFDYLWRRWCDGDGGNGYTYDFSVLPDIAVSEVDSRVAQLCSDAGEESAHPPN